MTPAAAAAAAVAAEEGGDAGAAGMNNAAFVKEDSPRNGSKPAMVSSVSSRVSNDGADGGIGKRRSASTSCMAAAHSFKVNEGLEDELCIFGFEVVRWRTLALNLCIVLTAGLLWLPLYWVPRWKLLLTHRRVPLDKATSVLVEDRFKSYSMTYVKPVLTRKGATEGEQIPLPSRFGTEQHLVASFRYFRCKKLTYVWDEGDSVFYPLRGLDSEVPVSAFHGFASGISEREQGRRRGLFGANAIIVPVVPIPLLIVKEVLNPFYVFQIASVTLWFADEYVAYACAIVIMSVIGIAASVYQLKKNEGKLRSTIQSSDTLEVLRAAPVGGEGQPVFERISSEDLVPGDVVSIPAYGCELHFDGVVISGSVIVNESLLTGECVPVTKAAVPTAGDDFYDARTHARNTLFCGTRVVQTRNYARQRTLAVVVRTGFLTTKGRLVLSIMYPAPVDFKFEQDSYKFVGFLASIAFTGFLYTTVTQLLAGEPIDEIALDALDLITIVVPPALPAAMTIGSVYAQRRLERKGIFCISQRTINVSGSLDCVCFDKTGTLTEDGLDMWGVIGSSLLPTTETQHDEKKGDLEQPAPSVKFCEPERDPKRLNPRTDMARCMTTCHSLTVIADKLTGDPLDLKMFQSTGWALEEPTLDTSEQFDNIAPTVVRPQKPSPDGDQDIGIIRQFPFSSSRQCMSVVARPITGDHFVVYCKGSPEKISQIARKETLPDNFAKLLEKYTAHGYRVIALSVRHLAPSFNLLKVQRMETSDAEKDVDFLGFVVLENRLKPESAPVIKELQRANLRTVMVTGDNVNTALSVARECGMIGSRSAVILVKAEEEENGDAKIGFHQVSTGHHRHHHQRRHKSTSSSSLKDIALDMEKGCYHFAIDGESFGVVRRNFPEVADRVTVRGTVFARMSPDQKQTLIEHLQALGYYVGMCGDGANDCGALKCAHAGISLSDAESSVASPFTSKEPNIACVPELIREGRCALVTSFGIFKYMAAYSLTQFVSVLLLYSIDSNLADIQFLFIDLFLITTFAFFFGLAEAYEGDLDPHPPMKSLISLTPITSLILQLAIVIGFQVFAFENVRAQDWFVPFDPDNPSYSNTSAEGLYNDTTIADSEMACWENYAIFTVSSFQYIILAYAFSKSRPYRKYVFTNYWFVGSLVVLTAFTVYLVIEPAIGLQYYFELFVPPNTNYRLFLLGVAALNVALCVIVEDVFMEYVIFRGLRKQCNISERSKRKFLSIEKWLSSHAAWPHLSVDSASGPAGSAAAVASSVAAPRISVSGGLLLQVTDKGELEGEEDAFRDFSEIARNNQNEERERPEWPPSYHAEAASALNNHHAIHHAIVTSAKSETTDNHEVGYR